MSGNPQEPAKPGGRKPGGRKRGGLQLTRRNLLIAGAAGGGIIAVWALVPRDYPVPLSAGEAEQAFNAWIKVGRDGVVTVAVPELEMGQGSTTLYPRIAAEELGADWRQVAVEPAAISAAYADPVLAARWAGLWSAEWLGAAGWLGLADDPDDYLVERHAETERLMATAEGTGIAAYEMKLREAAAAVRTLLAMAAADRWDVNFEECSAQAGFIVHGDKRLRFGELVDEAAELTPPDPVPLRPDPATASMPELTGAAAMGEAGWFGRLDAPSKVDGSYPFAADIRIPDLVYAAIAHGPLADGELDGFDPDANDGAARRVIGYLGRVEGPGWLACVANSQWAAEKALGLMKPRFRPGRELSDDARIDGALDLALAEGTPEVIHQRADPLPALQGIGVTEASYSFAPQLHGTIETTSATARFLDGRLSLWMASQAPGAARKAAADALGMLESDVVVLPVGAGGSFDARLEVAIAREVAAIAFAIGRPVQLTYSRWQEHLRALPLPPARIDCRALVGQQSTIRAWHSRIARPAAARQMHARLDEGLRPEAAMDATSGTVDPPLLMGHAPPYAIPELLVDAVPADIGVPVGRLRGNGEIHPCFATESFVDEVARANGEEPLSFRVAMMGDNPRLFACLQGAAQIAGWDGGIDGSSEGLACWQMADPAGRPEGGGHIAVIANARLGSSESGGGVEVSSLSAFVDIGRIIDYDLALQQIEGGLLYGMALALGMAVSFEGGLPHERTLGALNLPQLSRMPEISVAFAENDAPPFDPGEIGVVAAPPAIANALRAATGSRYRTMPIRVAAAQLAPANPQQPADAATGEAAPEPAAEEVAPDAAAPAYDEPVELPDGSMAR